MIVSATVIKLLESTANDDWRKICEFVRLLAGLRHPGCTTSAQFKPKLKEVDDDMARKAGEIVDKHKDLIFELTNFFLQKRMDVAKVAGRPPQNFALTQKEIDNFPPIKAAFP
jgi:hypothetical protein